MSGASITPVTKLGEWAQEHAQNALVLPPTDAPPDLAYAAIHALRGAFDDDADEECAFMAGVAYVIRHMVEQSGCDFVASVISLDLSAAEQAS